MPIAAALPTAAAATADPAFALIAEKLAEDAAHGEAIDAQDEAERDHEDGSPRLCSRCAGGVAALQRRVRRRQRGRLAAGHDATHDACRRRRGPPIANEIEGGGMEWPATDTVGAQGWHYQLRATMAVAIEVLIKARAGEAVQA
jgi:hypothetical protein